MTSRCLKKMIGETRDDVEKCRKVIGLEKSDVTRPLHRGSVRHMAPGRSNSIKSPMFWAA